MGAVTAAERTREVFDKTAASYDPARARLIPGFDAFYGAALALIPAEARRILDLGAGTGLFSAMVRARVPSATLRLIDNSAPMLDQARQRFGEDVQVGYQLGDYGHEDWGSGYDAIVSALSIHHLEDAAKAQLFGRVRKALQPGGVFINAEQILAPTPESETRAKAEWLNEVRALDSTEKADLSFAVAADRGSMRHRPGSAEVAACSGLHRGFLPVSEGTLRGAFFPRLADHPTGSCADWLTQRTGQQHSNERGQKRCPAARLPGRELCERGLLRFYCLSFCLFSRMSSLASMLASLALSLATVFL